MSEPLEQSQRQVVPRWRDFQDAVRVGELGSSLPPKGPAAGDEANFRAAREVWDRAVSRGSNRLALLLAPDVMGNALLLGKPGLASDVARGIVDSEEDLPHLVGDLARRVTQALDRQPRLELPVHSGIVEVEQARDQVRRLRRRLAVNPHNPIGWVELARAYTIAGSTGKASRAIAVALDRSGRNRFVVRSAARFFVHVGQPDRAVALLSGTGIEANDPWLLASELAISHLAGLPPRSTRPARRLADNAALSAFERSELLSAIATLELASGSDKRAGKLFDASLVDPHENSLAQAEWASERVAKIRVPSELFVTPDSYEARARDSAARGNWKQALQQSLYWQHVEPFSAEAAIHGSYVAAVGLGDFAASREIASQALASNPSNAVLRNNLAYAEANLGHLVEATEQLRHMRLLIDNRRLQVPYLATSGLVAYRSGDMESGRMYYREAVDTAKGLPDAGQVQALVWANFAQEELRVQGDQQHEVLEQALETGKEFRRADLHLLLTRLGELSQDQGRSSA